MISYGTIRRFPAYPSLGSDLRVNPSQLLPGYYPTFEMDNLTGGKLYLMLSDPQDVRISIGNSVSGKFIKSQVPYHSGGTADLSPFIPASMSFDVTIPSEPYTIPIEMRMKSPAEKFSSHVMPPATGSVLLFDNIGYAMWFYGLFMNCSIRAKRYVSFNLFAFRTMEPGNVDRLYVANPTFFTNAEYLNGHEFPKFPNTLDECVFYFDNVKMDSGMNNWKATVHVFGKWYGGVW